MSEVRRGPRITGEEILAFRRELQLTQSQFGERLGVTASKISNWERERNRVSHAYERLLTAYMEAEAAEKALGGMKGG